MTPGDILLCDPGGGDAGLVVEVIEVTETEDGWKFIAFGRSTVDHGRLWGLAISWSIYVWRTGKEVEGR